jgi:tetratricopeptide (TPR) repeat protein
LADAYISLGSPWIGGLPPRQALQEAKTAAENAIRLSSDLSEAHVSLAHVLVLHDWDWRRAEEEYQRAIALDPQKAALLDPVNMQYAVGYPFRELRRCSVQHNIYSAVETFTWVKKRSSLRLYGYDTRLNALVVN